VLNWIQYSEAKPNRFNVFRLDWFCGFLAYANGGAFKIH